MSIEKIESTEEERSYDEERLLSLRAPAFSIKYGQDLMMKHPSRFNFSKMIDNFAEWHSTINKNSVYLKNTREQLIFIFENIGKIYSTGDNSNYNNNLDILAYSIYRYFTSINTSFDNEMLEALLSGFSKAVESIHNIDAIEKMMMYVIDKLSVKITEDVFFEYSNIIPINRRFIHENEWARPQTASDKFRMYMLMNHDDLGYNYDQ